MGVGDNLKAILKQKRMTIKCLSEKSGIPVNTLYSITKRNAGIDEKTAKKIADTLSIPTDTIYSSNNYNDYFASRFRQAAQGIFENNKIDEIIDYANKYAEKHCKESLQPKEYSAEEFLKIYEKLDDKFQNVMLNFMKMIVDESHSNSAEGDNNNGDNKETR